MLGIDQIEIGTVFETDLFDSEGNRLLPRGTVVTAEFVEKLSTMGIDHVSLALIDTVDSQNGVPDPSTLFAHNGRTRDRRLCDFSETLTRKFDQVSSNCNEVLQKLSTEASSPTTRTLRNIADVNAAVVDVVIDDADHVGILMARSDSQRKANPFKNALQASQLAIGLGLESNLNDSEVESLGIAGLLHNCCLLANAESSPVHDSVGDRASFCVASQSAELVRNHSVFSNDVCLLIAQSRELIDGSGKPRGITRNRMYRHTHLLSAVIMYVDLVNPTRSRARLVGHDALRVMLHRCKQGLVSQDAMSLLLQHVTLFPIGSRVQLNDGEHAIVVRRFNDYSQPTLSPLKENDYSRQTDVWIFPNADRTIQRIIHEPGQISISALDAPHFEIENIVQNQMEAALS